MTIEEMLFYGKEYDQYEDMDIEDGGIDIPIGLDSTYEMEHGDVL